MRRALALSSVGLLALIACGGVWIVIAPHVVGYQPWGEDWTFKTRADLVAGAVVLGVSLLTLGGYLAASVRARVRRD